MKTFLISLINLYQYTFSPDKGIFRKKMPTCVFFPTCSEYAKQAIQKYGAFKGIWLGTKRILRCHPWQKEHIDFP